MNIFNIILYQPLFNLLVWLYNTASFGDLGVAIILLTLVIKIILFPLAQKSIHSQRALQKLQPKMEELKVQYKDNREELSKAMMNLYKQEKINPLSSCLPLLIQLPILIAVYQVFIHGLKNGSLDMLYPFVQNPGQLNVLAFGFLDLSQKNVILGVLAAAAQYWQSKMMISKQVKAQGTAAMMNQQMLYMIPGFTIVLSFTLPSGLMLYWLATTVFSIIQQEIFIKRKEKKEPAATVS